MYQEAKSSYKMARDFALQYLGADDAISQNLSDIYEKADAEIQQKIMKTKLGEEKLA